MRLSQLFSSTRATRSSATAQTVETPVTAENSFKPADSQLDLFGITHPGKVRSENQDHFLVCTVHPQVVVHGSSLPAAERLPLRGQRLATMLLVADGVGGHAGGSEASRLAAEAITAYVASTLRCYHAAGSSNDRDFLDALHAAALKAHESVSVESAIRGDQKMATTLTLAIAVWPWMYVLQVGDSRCYFFCDGKLRQVTRDQTMAQDLVDQGVLPAERMTGQAQNASLTQSQFKSLVCSKIVALFDCTNGISIDVQSYSQFNSVNVSSPIDGSKNFTNPNNYSPGGPGDIVVVRVFYQWPILVTKFGYDISNLAGSKRLLTATAAFQNEPF